MNQYASITLFMLIFLGGCDTLPPTLSQQVSQSGASAQIFTEAEADAAFQQGLDSDSASLLEKAATAYEAQLKKAPSSAALQYKTYSSYYHLIRLGNSGNYDRAKELFLSLPGSVRRQLAPPGFARLGYLSGQKNTTKQVLEQTILDALDEAPTHAGSHVQLARIRRAQGDLLLPVAVKRQALHLNPDDPDIRLELGYAYADLVLDRDCSYESRDSISKALQLLQAERGRSPTPFYVSATLARLYRLLGMAPLQLREAQKAYELKPVPYTQYELAAALLDSKRWDDANEHYKELIALGESYLAMEQVSAYAANGQWQQARQAANQFLKNNRPASFYHVLTIKLIESQPGIPPEHAYSDLMGSVKMSRWQQVLNAYWQERLSETVLLNNADDICKSTEAHYYVGLKHLLKGDEPEAKRHFAKVLESNATAFIEYGYATQLLKQMKTKK